MKTLLLGMGNTLLCDDGVGVRLAKDFKERLANVPELTVVDECCVGGLNILDVMAGYDRVIVIDAIKTAGGLAGTTYHFDAERLRETEHVASVHDVNFATALELGRKSGMPLPKPEDIHILAVEVEDNATFSERMSPALEGSYSRYATAVYAEIQTLLAS